MTETSFNIDFYAPRFEIKINDTSLHKDAVISLDVDESIDKPGMFTLSLNEELDIESQEFTWLDKKRNLIMPGNEVFISFGYASMSGKFRGKIKAISPGFPSTGTPTLKVEGYDLSYSMKKKESDFKDKDMRYSDVAKEIATKNGLEFDNKTIEDTKKVYKEKKIKRNMNEDDYALLERLAKEIFYEFFVRDKELYFRSPKDNEPKNNKTFVFKFRKNIIGFNPRLTTAPSVNEVEVTGWNEKSKKPVMANAKIPEIISSLGIPDFDKIIENSEGNKSKLKIEGRLVESEEDAKMLAVAELKRSNNGFVEGTLECIGNPDLRPGMNIEITNVGKNWFSGMYYIKGAKHSLSGSGYTTNLDVRRCL